VPTSLFVEIRSDHVVEDVKRALDVLSFPMIIKPSASYGSVGISDQSVVWNEDEAVKQSLFLHSTVDCGVFVEKFLAGREFTALVLGDAEYGIQVFDVVERVFDTNLSTYQKFLTFDRNWEGFSLDGSAASDFEDLKLSVIYKPAPQEAMLELKRVAKEAYLALNGTGYARVDIRSDSFELSNNFYVLEVNSNCGISFDINSTVGEILHLSNSVHMFIHDVLSYALKRKK